MVSAPGGGGVSALERGWGVSGPRGVCVCSGGGGGGCLLLGGFCSRRSGPGGGVPSMH